MFDGIPEASHSALVVGDVLLVLPLELGDEVIHHPVQPDNLEFKNGPIYNLSMCLV